MANNFDLRKFLTENKLTSNSKLISEDVDIESIRNAVRGKSFGKGPEVDAIFKYAEELLANGDAKDMVDALEFAALTKRKSYFQDDNVDGMKVADTIRRAIGRPQTQQGPQDLGKKKKSVDIDGIRNAVEGPEADAIFKTAEKYLKDGDAQDMRDALNMAADEYYEYYNSKSNEDGLEVAKYIMRSTE